MSNFINTLQGNFNALLGGFAASKAVGDKKKMQNEQLQYKKDKLELQKQSAQLQREKFEYGKTQDAEKSRQFDANLALKQGQLEAKNAATAEKAAGRIAKGEQHAADLDFKKAKEAKRAAEAEDTHEERKAEHERKNRETAIKEELAPAKKALTEERARGLKIANDEYEAQQAANKAVEALTNTTAQATNSPSEIAEAKAAEKQMETQMNTAKQRDALDKRFSALFTPGRESFFNFESDEGLPTKSIATEEQKAIGKRIVEGSLSTKYFDEED